jgi:hypothetical protein
MRHLALRGCAPLLLALSLAAGPAVAAESPPRPITHEDVWLMKRPGAVAVSPDGRWIVPSRLVVFPDENHWVLKGENSRYFYQEVHGWLAKYL